MSELIYNTMFVTCLRLSLHWILQRVLQRIALDIAEGTANENLGKSWGMCCKLCNTHVIQIADITAMLLKAASSADNKGIFILDSLLASFRAQISAALSLEVK